MSAILIIDNITWKVKKNCTLKRTLDAKVFLFIGSLYISSLYIINNNSIKENAYISREFEYVTGQEPSHCGQNLKKCVFPFLETREINTTRLPSSGGTVDRSSREGIWRNSNLIYFDEGIRDSRTLPIKICTSTAN